MVTLDLVHGLKQRPGKPTARYRFGKPRYRGAFDLAEPEAQVYVRDTCLKAVGKSKLKANAVHSICVLSIFETDFLAPMGLALPLGRDDFRNLFAEFRQSNVLLDGSRVEEWIGFDCATNEATWVRDNIVLTVRKMRRSRTDSTYSRNGATTWTTAQAGGRPASEEHYLPRRRRSWRASRRTS